VWQTFACLREKGTFNYLVTSERAAPFRYSPYCHGFEPFDFGTSDDNLDCLQAMIDRIVQTHGIDVIVCCEGGAALPMILLGNRIRHPVVPLPSLKDFWVHNDKWLFRQLCEDIGVPTPKSLRFADKLQLQFDELATALGTPFIIKPNDCEGGRGIVKIGSTQEFENKIRLDDAYCYGPLLAQEFVPGQDIDISLLASGGEILCHAVQFVKGGVTCFVQANELLGLARRIVERTGFNGLVHFDARQDSRDGSFKFIESNPRVWASINRAKACGLNFLGAAIDLAMGRRPEGVRSIAGVHYRASPEFFGRLFTGQAPLDELDLATMAQVWDDFRNPRTFFLKKYVRARERAAARCALGIV
jgi:predicted ATP-grasp superfamily ATP-dependent carboligase